MTPEQVSELINRISVGMTALVDACEEHTRVGKITSERYIEQQNNYQQHLEKTDAINAENIAHMKKQTELFEKILERLSK